MAPTMIDDAPITVLLCALGGEGGGVLADWLVEVAKAVLPRLFTWLVMVSPKFRLPPTLKISRLLNSSCL